MVWKWFIGVHEIPTKIKLGIICGRCRVGKTFSERFPSGARRCLLCAGVTLGRGAFRQIYKFSALLPPSLDSVNLLGSFSIQLASGTMVVKSP